MTQLKRLQVIFEQDGTRRRQRERGRGTGTEKRKSKGGKIRIEKGFHTKETVFQIFL